MDSSRKSPSTIIFGLIFAVIGLAILWFLGAKPGLLALDARSWDAIQCKVTASEVKSKRSDDGYTYAPIIRLSWSYRGRSYEGGQYASTEVYSSGASAKHEIVRQYPVGEFVPCYVNPDNASHALLSTSIPITVWIGLGMGGLFFAIGLYITLGGIGIIASTGVHQSQGDSEVSRESISHAPLVPSATPRQTFIGMLCFAFFWNAIVGVIGYIFLVEGADETPIFAKIIVGIFALIGVGLLIAAVRAFMQIFLPYPEFTISESAPALGESFKVAWTFNKDPRQIRALTIAIQGKESATYRQGTDTRTDTSTFYEKELYAESRSQLFSNDAITVRIPRESMHSFTSANNSISWVVSVKGDVSRWPDLALEYPIFVNPAPS